MVVKQGWRTFLRGSRNRRKRSTDCYTSLDIERRRTDRFLVDVESREQALSEAERTADGRARADARQLLMDARAEVESVITELRAAAREGRDLEEATRTARQKVERSASRQKEAVSGEKGSHRSHDRAEEAFEKKETGNPETRDGEHVRIRANGGEGPSVGASRRPSAGRDRSTSF